MTRLFVLFLIVLLPLRGWAGDVMSMRMAQQLLATVSAAAAMSAMPADCPMHAQGQVNGLQPGHGTDAASDEAGMMKNCTSCDLCLPLAALACARVAFAAFADDAKPQIGVDDFVSAALAPAQKPPIF